MLCALVVAPVARILTHGRMKAMPTILQVLPRLQSGGVERGTVEIAEAITRAGMRALIASSGGPLTAKITRLGGTHVELPLASKNPWVMYRNAVALYQLIRREKVEVVHARSRAPAWSAFYATKWARVPFVTTFHGVYSTEGLFKKYYNAIMTRGARVIAVSQFVEAHLREEYGVEESRIRLIPRGVDFAQFDAAKIMPARVAELIKSWRLPEDTTPIIFCPGRITRIKGQHVLIQALSLLRQENFLCIIAGDDVGHESYREEMEEQVVKSGLEGKVRFVSNTNAMAEAYQLSQLVVVPSIKPESFGRVAIEAQAMGRLVVATDHGGARETIVNNETGYLVPPENALAMAEAIRFALALDANTREAMAKFAQAHVRKHFTSQQMQDKTIAVYRELLETP
jgi:glycosyltransferase involved in cell wall biosynthesis